jgi:hypothetical protein
MEFSPKNPLDPKDFTGYWVMFLDDEDKPDDHPRKRRKIKRSYFCNHIDDNFLTIKV